MKLSALLLLVLSLTLFSCQESFDKRCQREAIEYTAKFCPQNVAPGITMDSMTYDIPARTMTYYYSIAKELDNQEVINKNAEEFKGAMLNSIKNSLELKRCKDEGIIFKYIYRSSTTRKELLNITFTEKDYK